MVARFRERGNVLTVCRSAGLSAGFCAGLRRPFFQKSAGFAVMKNRLGQKGGIGKFSADLNFVTQQKKRFARSLMESAGELQLVCYGLRFTLGYGLPGIGRLGNHLRSLLHVVWTLSSHWPSRINQQLCSWPSPRESPP